MLTGGCLHLGTDGLPFAPFTAMLRDLVRELGADTVTAMVPGRGGRDLARLLPELGELDDGRDPGEARARLFEELFTLLERLASTGPVILIIEDAHWADESTRSLLAFLIGQQRALRGVLIVVTFRSDELTPDPPAAGAARRTGPDRVGATDGADQAHATRDRGTRGLPAGARAQPGPGGAAVRARSEGNPLFTEELVHCPDLTRDLPESLRDLLLATVARLPDQAREVLRIASAGLDPNGHALLSAVTRLDDEELIRATLRPAVIANVLLATRAGYSFRHALIREAVYNDLLPGEGERLHARFAAGPGVGPLPGRARPGGDRGGASLVPCV